MFHLMLDIVASHVFVVNSAFDHSW